MSDFTAAEIAKLAFSGGVYTGANPFPIVEIEKAKLLFQEIQEKFRQNGKNIERFNASQQQESFEIFEEEIITMLQSTMQKDSKFAECIQNITNEIYQEFNTRTDNLEIFLIEASLIRDDSVIKLGETAKSIFLGTLTGTFIVPLLSSLLGTSSAVNLSEESLRQIGIILGQQLNESWLNRDKLAAKTLFETAGKYRRLSDTDQELLFSLEQAIRYRDKATEIANNLGSYGMTAAPTYQLVGSMNISFHREIVELMKLLRKSQETIDFEKKNLRDQAKIHLDQLNSFMNQLNNYCANQFRVRWRRDSFTCGRVCCSERGRFCVEGPIGWCTSGGAWNSDCIGESDEFKRQRAEAWSKRTELIGTYKNSILPRILSNSYTDNLNSLRQLMNWQG